LVAAAGREREGSSVTGLMTTVTNVMNGKRYFVSTIKSPGSGGLQQTAVFRKIFGPFANFWRPQATFFGNDAANLHGRVTALVRDVDPADWNVKDMLISAEGDEVAAAFDAMTARLRGAPTATE
jgi:hypothetical protein